MEVSKITMKNKPLVEVIVLHHEGLKIMKNCMNSLAKTKYSNMKISVVLQECADGSKEWIEKNHKKVNLVINEKNKSFSAANNQILKVSRAKYCVLLNDDTEQDSSWISKFVEFAEKNPEFSALQPKVLSLRDKKYFEYAGAGGGFIDIYGYPVCRGRVFDSMEKNIGQYDDSRQVFWACGVAMFLRMDAARKTGYLDEDLGTYAEELDLSWRMNNAGYKVGYVGGSVIYHLGSATWGKKKYATQKLYLIHRNTLLMMIKNYSSSSLLKILPRKIALEWLNIFAFMFSAPQMSMAALKTLVWLMLNPLAIIKKHAETQKIRRVSDEEVSKLMIDTSVALRYFLENKKGFKDYARHIDALKNEKK
jgi:GT2 family glycosyltransferase